MSTADNKAIIRAWIEAWIRNDVTQMSEWFAPNYTVNGELIGIEGVQQAVQFLHAALANISAELNDIVAEDDRVAIRWTIRGRHDGHLMGLPPTGRELELKGINIYQMVNQKIVANHEQTNIAEVIRGLRAERETEG